MQSMLSIQGPNNIFRDPSNFQYFPMIYDEGIISHIKSMYKTRPTLNADKPSATLDP